MNIYKTPKGTLFPLVPRNFNHHKRALTIAHTTRSIWSRRTTSHWASTRKSERSQCSEHTHLNHRRINEILIPRRNYGSLRYCRNYVPFGSNPVRSAYRVLRSRKEQASHQRLQTPPNQPSMGVKMTPVFKMLIIVGFSIPYIVSVCLAMERYRTKQTR